MVADHKTVGPFISLSVPEHRRPTSLFLSIAQDAPTRYPSFSLLRSLCGAGEALWRCSVAMVECAGEINTFTATDFP